MIKNVEADKNSASLNPENEPKKIKPAIGVGLGEFFLRTGRSNHFVISPCP